MIPVSCHTNLDLRGEHWPTMLPGVPNVGDEIESATTHKYFRLRLRVCSVTWKFSPLKQDWYLYVELHMTKMQSMLMPLTSKTAAQGSIVAFYDWYAPLVGTTPGAFI